MRAARRTLERCRRGRDVRQAEECVLYPSQHKWNESERNQENQNRRTNPDSEPPVFWIMDRAMRIIEGNHKAFHSSVSGLEQRFWKRAQAPMVTGCAQIS
jgi:hypothetical protein